MKVSGALDPGGLTGIRRAAAGWLDGRYYLCLEREEKSRLLVYDTERGLWHEENPGGAGSLAMLSSGRQLYLWDGAGPLGGRPRPGGGRPFWPGAKGRPRRSCPLRW